MLDISHQSKSVPGGMGVSRSYKEIVEYLDALPVREYGPQSLERMKALDAACSNASQGLRTILVAGTNGKSTTINFMSKLFEEEGLGATLIYSSHIMVYNERLVVGKKRITNKEFTQLLNDIIAVATLHNIAATSAELMTMAGIVYAQRKGAEVAVFEVGLGGRFDPTALCKACIIGLTRVGDDATGVLGDSLDQVCDELMTVVQPGAWFASSEQSKIRLQHMKSLADTAGARWSMPIRKLAPLPYVYEQLYGRIASLSERLVQLYVEEITKKFSPFLRGNLHATQKGQRGRPTLSAKRNHVPHQVKPLKTFWAESCALLRGRFEVLRQERPTMLLDNASNVDAFLNLFLGIRLLHYDRAIKGFVLIIAVARSLDVIQVLKHIRYLLKKVPGKVFFVPHAGDDTYFSPEELVAHARKLHISARGFHQISDAIKAAKSFVDERDGLVAISGSEKQITAYWRDRGACLV